MKKLTIIGGGASAMMFAANIDSKKYQVTLCEKNKSLGRKFLLAASKGGLNITFNTSLDKLIEKYYPSEFMEKPLRTYSNSDLIEWFEKIKIKTFVGSSNRVFVDLKQKPIDILRKITRLIEDKNVTIKYGMEWIDWDKSGNLCFKNGEVLESDINIFALGGASWKATGSNGKWVKPFENKNVKTLPFRAANCAFSVNWQKEFITKHEGKPLKNISLQFKNQVENGELIITKFGLEGNAIYALSKLIQDELLHSETAIIHLDLKPTLTIDQVKTKYQTSNSKKVTDILKYDLNFDRTQIAFIKHFTDRDTFQNPKLICEVLKSLPIPIRSAGDIDKAITTLGGISLDELDYNFQLKKNPNNYAVGEMLDWFAPTGGYNLQGCFSMGYALAEYLNSKYKTHI